MKSVTFDSNLLPSPFICLDQLITSFTYSAHTVKLGQNHSLFLVPRSSLLYPTSLLGYVYSELLQYANIKRIVYVREGSEQTTILSGDASIDCVLGGSVGYDLSYYARYRSLDAVSRTEFGIHDLMRSHHVLYARYVNDIEIVPFVLPKKTESDSIDSSYWHTMFSDILADDTTVCILLSDYSFVLSDDVVLDTSASSCDLIHDIFESYCLHQKKEPSLLEGEHLVVEGADSRYQGIFVL